jgi:PKD repeat protein
MSCAASTEFAISEHIDISSNSGVAAAHYKVTLTATGAGGTVKKTTPLEVEAYRWLVLTSRSTGRSAYSSLSCSTLKVCVAVGAGGQAIAFDPSGVHRTTLDSSHSLQSVSCIHGAPLFCVAVDDSGQFLSDRAGVWSPPKALPTGADGLAHSVSSVACTVRRSSTNVILGQRCVAADVAGNAFVLDFTTGVTAPSMSLDSSGLTGRAFVGCASDTACLVVDAMGEGVMFDGSMWSTPHQLTNKVGVTGASCTSSGFCAVSHSSGGVTYFSTFASAKHCPPGTVDWNGICTRTNGPPEKTLGGVSCTSGLCVAISNSGSFYQQAVGTFIGNGWDAAIKCPCFNGSVRVSAVACSLDSTSPLQLGCAFVTNSSKGAPTKEYVGHVSLLK